MGNITLPPKKKVEQSSTGSSKIVSTEKRIQDVINKGGSPTKNNDNNTEGIKQINIQLLVSEVEAIRELRELRPKTKRGGKRLAISLHDWIVEAVQEKINRDVKKVYI